MSTIESYTAQPMKFVDELDAASKATEFIRAVYEENKDKYKQFEQTINGLANGDTITCGGVQTLWADNEVIAIANFVRTNYNWTQLICTRVTTSSEMEESA